MSRGTGLTIEKVRGSMSSMRNANGRAQCQERLHVLGLFAVFPNARMPWNAYSGRGPENGGGVSVSPQAFVPGMIPHGDRADTVPIRVTPWCKEALLLLHTRLVVASGRYRLDCDSFGVVDRGQWLVFSHVKTSPPHILRAGASTRLNNIVGITIRTHICQCLFSLVPAISVL